MSAWKLRNWMCFLAARTRTKKEEDRSMYTVRLGIHVLLDNYVICPSLDRWLLRWALRHREQKKRSSDGPWVPEKELICAMQVFIERETYGFRNRYGQRLERDLLYDYFR